MAWYIPIFLRIITGDIISKILIKKITGLPSRTRRLCWQFFFAMLYSYILAYFMGNLSLCHAWLIIAIIGVFNSYGAYCQWRAIDISLSKKSLFTQGDDLITMLLGYIILGETKILNLGIIGGIIVCLGAAGAIIWLDRKTESYKNMALLGWVAGFSIIWGVAVFSKRFFTLKDVSFATFLTAWYSGAWVGSLLILALAGKKEAGKKLNLAGIGSGLALASCIWLPLFLGYWTYTINYITIAQPFFMISEIIFPTLLGLFYFHEIKSITKAQKVAFGVAMAGIFIIALSYS